jgi:hypothetical protein
MAVANGGDAEPTKIFPGQVRVLDRALRPSRQFHCLG